MNNNTQPNTPIHTHAAPTLELQAVGGAIRLRRKADGIEGIRSRLLLNGTLPRFPDAR